MADSAAAIKGRAEEAGWEGALVVVKAVQSYSRPRGMRVNSVSDVQEGRPRRNAAASGIMAATTREIVMTDTDRPTHQAVPPGRDARREPSSDTAVRPPMSRGWRGRSDGPVPSKVVAAIGLAWLAGIAWLMTISPAPPENPPALSALDVIVQTAMLGSWLAVLAGVITRQRFLFGASIVGGMVLASAGLLCLVTGHTGLWIPAQIGTGLGLAGLGYGAARIT
jgi:hypothetical protein